MITQYFDINNRLIIQTPGTLAPATQPPWVYGDNYNLIIYLIAGGIFQPIAAGDSLGLILFEPGGTLPESNLAIISAPIIKTDPSGYNYYQINVNLKTSQLANLVQTPNQAAKLQFHYAFTPGTGERFSSSADLAITVNPDPLEDASGATPVPPGYPTSPSVFELLANKGVANGYPQLDASGKIPLAQLPTVTGGDMTKAVYDTNNNGIVDTCDSLQSSRVIGLGTAATLNVPASGNAGTNQIVVGSDTRLTDNRTPASHAASHLVGGADQLQLATTAAAGLCPPPDGSTVQIVGGKLTATTTGSGDMLKSVYDTNNDGVVDNAAAVQTHVVPPSGNATAAQLVLGSDTRLSDNRTPVLHAGTHNGGADPIPLASSAGQGLCPAVDNTTIQVIASKLSAVLASSSAPGIVRPDNSSITIASGVISSTAASGHGCRIWRSAAQTQSNTVPLSFDTNTTGAGLFDTDAYWSNANQTRITIPSGQAGYYNIGAMVLVPNGSGGTYRLLDILVNSAGSYGNNRAVAASGAVAVTNNQFISLNTIYKFAVGDYIELFYLTDQTSVPNIGSFGTTVRYSPIFWAFKISS